MTTFKKAAACALAVCSVALAVGSTPPAQASIAQPAVVSDNPADTTPHIVFDASSQDVRAYAQVGRTVYAGGRFNHVQDPARTTTYNRQNFVAFDRETGVISPLNLAFNGTVGAIEATANGTALFIAGSFSQVNGITRRGLVKYDLVNNRVDPTFLAGNLRTVSDIELANGSVIAAGNFSKHLVALNPTTGADLGTINITVAGVVDPTDETRVRQIAISPNGTRLVATGNFATVNDQGRLRAFMLNLGATATLSTWHAPRFDDDCYVWGRQDSAQGVDFSPDGTYFVIVATGGPTGTNGMCDAAARFETANVSSTVQPTWINWTGGDSLYSVAITGPAVYVGGHQRWLDNPLGFDSAGPGAVSRPGIGAIDPVTGRALSWNPTKSRNHGTMVLYATPQGLWVGSDGEEFGHEDHAGIGFAPLDSTTDTTDPTVTIATPPAGAVYARNRVVNADFSCADSGGSGLASCAGTVADGHAINTATLGQHTFTVTATDGAGNTRVLNRIYTVASGRPDARIRRGTRSVIGDGLYNTTGAGQTRTGSAALGGSVTYFVSAQNDAPFAEQLRIKGQPSSTQFTVQYRNPAGVNITSQVIAGSYRTPVLAPGGIHLIRAIVTILPSAPANATLARTVTVTSDTHPTIKDTVRFVTSRA